MQITPMKKTVSIAINGPNDSKRSKKVELLTIYTSSPRIMIYAAIEAIIGKSIHTQKWFTIQKAFSLMYLKDLIDFMIAMDSLLSNSITISSLSKTDSCFLFSSSSTIWDYLMYLSVYITIKTKKDSIRRTKLMLKFSIIVFFMSKWLSLFAYTVDGTYSDSLKISL